MERRRALPAWTVQFFLVAYVILLSGLLENGGRADAQKMLPVCPCSPTADCDFYFSGFPNFLPHFSISGGTPGTTHSFTTAPIVSRFGNAVATAHETGCFPLSRWCVPASSLMAQNTTGLPSLNGLFSVTGNHLAFTTPASASPYQGLCILLTLTGISIAPNPTGLGNSPASYPVARQCVVFQTAAAPGADCSGYQCAAAVTATAAGTAPVTVAAQTSGP